MTHLRKLAALFEAVELAPTSSVYDEYGDRGEWKEALGGALGGGTLAGLAAMLTDNAEDASYWGARGAVMGGALGLTGAFTDPDKALNMTTGAIAGGGAGAGFR